MESVIAGLPGFVEHPNPREGFKTVFSGYVPDENGEPEGDFVSVELTIPPPNFNTLKKIDEGKLFSGSQTAASGRDHLIELVFVSLKRNYKGVPRWLVEQSFDTPMMVALNAKMKEMAGLDGKKETGTTSP